MIFISSTGELDRVVATLQGEIRFLPAAMLLTNLA